MITARMDVLDRIDGRLRETEIGTLTLAREEIVKLRETVLRQRLLLERIYNHDETVLGGNLNECVSAELEATEHECGELQLEPAVSDNLITEVTQSILRMRSAGGMLANIAFNLAQHPGKTLTMEDVTILDMARRGWDVAASSNEQESVVSPLAALPLHVPV